MIESVSIERLRVSAAEAELLIHVDLEGPPVGIEVRGILLGPRCPGVSTVEVAYPLRSIATGDTTVTLRVVIPEPNAWSEATPFRYEGRVEVWCEGSRIDSRPFAVELRPPTPL